MNSKSFGSLLFVLAFLQVSFAQGVNSNESSSTPHFGVFGGVNLSNMSDLGSAVQFEYKANLREDLLLKLSAAYYQISVDANTNVKSFRHAVIDGQEFYYGSEYNIQSREYKSFPFSIGLQYLLKQSKITPYVLAEVGYNYIDAKSILSPAKVFSYNSYEEIPEEYKNNDYKSEPLPLSSFKYGLGLGGSYQLSDAFALDLRYIFYFDTEIVDTHQVLFGILF